MAAIAVAAVLLCGGCSDGRPTEAAAEPKTPGPMARPKAHGYAVTMRVGQTFTDGLETIVVKGERPAVIESVELVGGEGLELVGFSLVGPERTVNIHYTEQYPPVHPDLNQDLVVPGEGATVKPSTSMGWELLLGIKVTRPGYLVRDGVRIHYRVDGKEYAQEFPAELAVCTSVGMELAGECPFPDN